MVFSEVDTNIKGTVTRFSTNSSFSIIHSQISAQTCLTVMEMELRLRAVTLALLLKEWMSQSQLKKKTSMSQLTSHWRISIWDPGRLFSTIRNSLVLMAALRSSNKQVSMYSSSLECRNPKRWSLRERDTSQPTIQPLTSISLSNFSHQQREIRQVASRELTQTISCTRTNSHWMTQFNANQSIWQP